MYDTPFSYVKQHLQAFGSGHFRAGDLVRQAMQYFDRAGVYLDYEAFINAVDRAQLELGYTVSDGCLFRIRKS